ncbi:hypothetical protein N9X10_02870 [Gammaproteobacteria bacterium]|nr:hypothetical protein [Gammaproteobacteria bacterium]
MKKLFLLTLMSSSLFLSADLWKDYEPSEQQIQLTVVDVQSNYLDYYLVNLNKTWVRAMEVQKDLGQIVDYGVYTSDGASSPNVWLTITYADMASMAPSKEKEDAVNAEMKKRYGDNDEEMEKISKGYEEIRKMVDNQRINQVIFK